MQVFNLFFLFSCIITQKEPGINGLFSLADMEKIKLLFPRCTDRYIYLLGTWNPFRIDLCCGFGVVASNRVELMIRHEPRAQLRPVAIFQKIGHLHRRQLPACCLCIYAIVKPRRVLLITFAGTPATMALAGTSFVTTAPAATMALSPMVTPCSTVTFAPSHTFLPI